MRSQPRSRLLTTRPNLRLQNFLGWLVPLYVVIWAGSALVVSLSNRRYGDALASVLGLGVAAVLALGLLRRRREWLRSEPNQEEEAS